MSPTSYQAAPPRTTTISDTGDSVKPTQPSSQSGAMILQPGCEQLPLVVRGVLERRNPGRTRMNVNDARARLIWTQHHTIVLRHPVCRPSTGVPGNAAKVPRLTQV